MSTSAYLWNACALLLLVTWILQSLLPGRRGLVYSLLGAVLLTIVPLFGHPLRYWLCGLTPNASVPLALLLLSGILNRAGVAKLLRSQERRAAWIFGAVSAVFLYPSALGLGLRNFDTYSLGWPWLDWRMSSLLFGSVALAAFVLVWRGNRFGWILAVSAVLYLLRVQESRNFWDYIVDPVYTAAALIALFATAWEKLTRHQVVPRH